MVKWPMPPAPLPVNVYTFSHDRLGSALGDGSHFICLPFDVFTTPTAALYLSHHHTTGETQWEFRLFAVSACRKHPFNNNFRCCSSGFSCTGSHVSTRPASVWSWMQFHYFTFLTNQPQRLFLSYKQFDELPFSIQRILLADVCVFQP